MKTTDEMIAEIQAQAAKLRAMPVAKLIAKVEKTQDSLNAAARRSAAIANEQSVFFMRTPTDCC